MEIAKDIRGTMAEYLSPLAPFLEGREKGYTDIECNEDGSVWLQPYAGERIRADNLRIPPRILMSAFLLLASEKDEGDLSSKSPSLCTTWPGTTIRIQMWVPPCVESPSMVIRLPNGHRFTLPELVANGMLTEAEAFRLCSLVKAKRNIVVSGETGSGKTTLASALLDAIPETERVIIIEDVRELRCPLPNHLDLQYQAMGPYTCRHAVADSLRGNPDRIIIGEVRDGAALDLLKAWNTGHGGGITTIHANNAKSVRARLLSLVGEASAMPQESLVDQSVDVVCHMERTKDGCRLVEIREKEEQ